jgi:peptidoglycan/LPS O-acetylase OafA/YrhL
VAGLVILNPFGLAFLQGTLNRSGGDLLWQFVATVTGAGLAALLVMAWIECYIRERMLNRRLEAPPPAPREVAPDGFKSAKELPL